MGHLSFLTWYLPQCRFIDLPWKIYTIIQYLIHKYLHIKIWIRWDYFIKDDIYMMTLFPYFPITVPSPHGCWFSWCRPGAWRSVCSWWGRQRSRRSRGPRSRSSRGWWSSTQSVSFIFHLDIIWGQKPGPGAACIPGTEDPHKTLIFSPPVPGHLG